jgi:CheY-like chemotaxis protein
MKTSDDILNSKILIVDDSTVNINLLSRILVSVGFSFVSSTTQPEEVCALHLANAYDLILLDIQMPGMDGFEVMNGLKSAKNDTFLPILVVSAQPNHELASLNAGALDFISKPFRLTDLVSRIKNILHMGFAARQLQTQG